MHQFALTATRCGVACLLLVTAHYRWTESRASAQRTATPSAAVEIPMELLFSRPLLRGTVHGSEPLAMLIDPQIGTTLIAPALADRLNLKRPRNNGEIPQPVEFGFGSYRFPGVLVDIGDTGYVLPDMSPAGHPLTVLSLSAWGNQLVTIDYPRWRVRIEPGALPEPNGRDVFALTPGSRELRVDLAIGDRVIRCRIDPLFPGSVLLPAAYLSELPLIGKPAGEEELRIRGATLKAREARLADNVTLAGIEMKTPLVRFGASGDVAIIGHGWLSRLSITYDVARNRARLNRGQ